ncbi:MAG: TRAP transporter substrate-binding protein DctP [Actinobacteria bacterium]|nr:TRAP transporter substrate-binding protein DctP [Actinomycetota bacterium]
MKKASILGLVVLLVLGIGLALAACGEEEETTTTAAPETTIAVTGQETTTTAAAPETTTTEGAPAQEPLVFKMASTFNENETGGLITQHFIDLIEERTGGAVTFDLYPGSTLGDAPEMLGLVSSASVDIIPFGHPAAGADLPLLLFPMWCPGDQQTAIDYFNHLVFENPESSALILAEAEAHNIKYLGFVAGGSNVFGAKQPWTSLADLKGKKIATGGMIQAFQSIGFEAVQSFPPDTYENLSRGVADCFQMGFSPTVQMKWYEVAPHYMYDGTFAAGNPWTVNLNSWAKLTPETQQIFLDVAKEMEAWSTALTLQAEGDAVKALEEAGATIGILSAEDRAKWWDALFRVFIEEMCWPGAVAGGYTDAMTTVLSAAAVFTNTDWTPPAQ